MPHRPILRNNYYGVLKSDLVNLNIDVFNFDCIQFGDKLKKNYF